MNLSDEEKNSSLSNDLQSGVKNTLNNIKDIAKIGTKAAAGNYIGAAIDAIKNGTIRKTIFNLILAISGIFLLFSMSFLMIPTLMFGSVDENGKIQYVTNGDIKDYEGKFAISDVSYFFSAAKEMANLTEKTFDTKIDECRRAINLDFEERKKEYQSGSHSTQFKLKIEGPDITPEYYYYIPSMYCVHQEEDASELDDNTTQDANKALSSEEKKDLTYLGNFKLTFYCPCSICCGAFSNGITATGTTATQGRTIAVDKKKIPLGSQVYIEGYGWFTAEDTGGAIKGNRIDIFMSSHQAALNAGVQHANVYVSSSTADKTTQENTGVINNIKDFIGQAWDSVTGHWSNFVQAIVGAIFPDYETNIRNDKFLYELEYFMQLEKAKNYTIDPKIKVEDDEHILEWKFVDSRVGSLVTHKNADGSTYTSRTITLIYRISAKSLDYIADNLYQLNRGREDTEGYELNFKTYQVERSMQMGKNIMEILGVPSSGSGSGTGSGSSMMTPEEISKILNDLNISVTNDKRRSIVAAAITLIGKTTYNLGSKSSPNVDYPSQLDCSGFVTWAYGRAGINFVHGSANQYYSSKRISATELQPGDLGLLTEPNNIASGDYNHIGIYVGTDSAGNRVFIHCSGGHNGVYMESYPRFKVFVRPNVL